MRLCNTIIVLTILQCRSSIIISRTPVSRVIHQFLQMFSLLKTFCSKNIFQRGFLSLSYGYLLLMLFSNRNLRLPLCTSSFIFNFITILIIDYFSLLVLWPYDRSLFLLMSGTMRERERERERERGGEGREREGRREK